MIEEQQQQQTLETIRQQQQPEYKHLFEGKLLSLSSSSFSLSLKRFVRLFSAASVCSLFLSFFLLSLQAAAALVACHVTGRVLAIFRQRRKSQREMPESFIKEKKKKRREKRTTRKRRERSTSCHIETKL
jgi:uncharacterized membrane-anchored protein YitT (DUF2179 family)